MNIKLNLNGKCEFSSSLIHHVWEVKPKTFSENENTVKIWISWLSRERGWSLSHQHRNCLDWRNRRTLERRANQLRERQRRVEEWRGWRNAFMTNGCLETVVKETMSPRVLWHLNCSWIFIQILGWRLFIFLPSRLMRRWFVTERKGKLFKVRFFFF